MIRTLAVMAVAAVSLTVVAEAATQSVAVRGEAPIESGGFELKQTMVHYGDLNISSKQGAHALYARIREAAADSCATADMMTDRVKAEVQRCRQQAVKHAVAKVDSSELAKVANMKS